MHIIGHWVLISSIIFSCTHPIGLTEKPLLNHYDGSPDIGNAHPYFRLGYAILHAAMLIRLRLIAATQLLFALQLVTGFEFNISYLCIFECAVHVPIAPPQRINMSHCNECIYIFVGHESPTISPLCRTLDRRSLFRWICELSL